MPGTRAGRQLRASSPAGLGHEPGGVAAASHPSDSRVTSSPSVGAGDFGEVDPLGSDDELIELSHCFLPGRGKRRDRRLGLEGTPTRESER